MDHQKLVYDWNTIGHPAPLTTKRVYLNDETLRDGLQSPTVSDPCIDDKIHLLHLSPRGPILELYQAQNV